MKRNKQYIATVGKSRDKETNHTAISGVHVLLKEHININLPT